MARVLPSEKSEKTAKDCKDERESKSISIFGAVAVHPARLPYRLAFDVLVTSIIIFSCGIFVFILVQLLSDYSGLGYELQDDGVFRYALAKSYYSTSTMDWSAWLHYVLVSLLLTFVAPPLCMAAIFQQGNESIFKSFSRLPLLPLYLGFAFQSAFVFGNFVMKWYDGHATRSIIWIGSVAIFTYQVAKQNESNIHAQCIKVVVLFGCLFVGSTQGPIKWMKDASQDMKLILSLVVVPVAKELGFMLVRSSVQQVNGKGLNPSGDIAFMSIYAMYFSIVLRFLFTKLNTYFDITTVVILNGVVEVALRFTHTSRDKILLHLENAVARCFGWKEQNMEMFDSAEFRASRARLLLCECSCEFVAILCVPAVLPIYDNERLFMDVGYDRNVPLDYYILIYSFCLSLVVEFITDVYCVQVELQYYGYPIAEEWRNKFNGYTLVFIVASLVCWYFFRRAFLRIPPACPPTYQFCRCFDQIEFEHQRDYCLTQWINTTASF